MSRGLIIGPRGFYGACSIYIGPLVFILTGIVCVTSRQVMVRSQPLGLGVYWGSVGSAYVGPILVCLVLPEWISYGVGGFALLKLAAPFCGALTILAIFSLVFRALKRLHSNDLRRVLMATCLAAFAQGIPASLLIR